MKSMISITELESTTIYGGRSEIIGQFVYGVSRTISRIVKMFYVCNREGMSVVGQMGVNGDMTIWK